MGCMDSPMSKAIAPLFCKFHDVVDIKIGDVADG